MPLSEFLAKTSKPNSGTSASTHPSTMNNSSTPFYLSDNEFAELVWENGQIAMHDHSTRPKKFPETVRGRDPDATTGIAIRSGSGSSFFTDKGKFNATELIMANEFPGNGNGFLGAEDEELVPWIHYPLDNPLMSSPLRPPDPLHADFCSDFFEEFAGTNPGTLDLTGAQATTGTGAELSKEETGVTNFSLFKERMASGARASTSTMYKSEHRNATDRATVRANEKESSKRHETVLASSSVCSVNGEGFENTKPKHAGKRKIREGEESSSNSEEMEDESAEEKRVAIGSGASTKKSRAAEVHNLSERRRRERINEKMKALQELIPNCSKADKASMLEDAIEYLKTLQLQVQMMSMGSRMFMAPPVMIPPMMQPLRAPPMAHYSPLGLGLYPMGMYPPLHGSAVVPIPQLHPQQFIQGPPAMHGMVAPAPLHPQVPVPASVNPRPTAVGSSSEDATADGASVTSTLVRENGGGNPNMPDPKAEML